MRRIEKLGVDKTLEFLENDCFGCPCVLECEAHPEKTCAQVKGAHLREEEA